MRLLQCWRLGRQITGTAVGVNADLNDLEVERLLQLWRFLMMEKFGGRI